MAIWLVEGLPGAGKSTLARQLCELASAAGHRARWYLEENHHHPVHPMSLRARRNCGEPAFARDCLDAWASFAARHGDQDVLHILEGSALQSSVRLMLEAGYPGIDAYFRRFEEIVGPLAPRMVYLRSTDPLAHSHLTSRIRGEAWAGKVSNYLERTRYCKDRAWSGLDGMHAFWQDYAALCDRLVAGTRLETCIVDFVPGNWVAHLPRAQAFLFQALEGVPRARPPRLLKPPNAPAATAACPWPCAARSSSAVR